MFDPNDILLQCAQSLYARLTLGGIPIDYKSLVDAQTAPEIIQAIRYYESGKYVGVEDMRRFSLSGGRDHPDPTLRSMECLR